MQLFYTLDNDNNPVPIDVLGWSNMLSDTKKRTVKQEWIGDFQVSTVFIGIRMSYSSGPPLLWETMIFPRGSDEEQYCDRYSTYKQALKGHAKAVKLAKQGLKGGVKGWLLRIDSRLAISLKDLRVNLMVTTMAHVMRVLINICGKCNSRKSNNSKD